VTGGRLEPLEIDFPELEIDFPDLSDINLPDLSDIDLPDLSEIDFPEFAKTLLIERERGGVLLCSGLV